MPAGTNYRVEIGETLETLVTAVDAVIAADSTWSPIGQPHFCKDEKQWAQAMVKGASLVVGAGGKIVFGASDNYLLYNPSTEKFEFWANGTKEVEIP